MFGILQDKVLRLPWIHNLGTGMIMTYFVQYGNIFILWYLVKDRDDFTLPLYDTVYR
jgi:hypothetical protein